MSDNSKLLKINSEQVLQHFHLLGYGSGDTVHLRLFVPDSDPRYGTPSGARKIACELPLLPWDTLEFLQSEGFGLYGVVNGGGAKDAEVTQGRAIFYEHDDLAKDQQQILYQHLGLPEPTLQVDTGGKSIHSYWVFEEPIPIPEWRQLQADLLEFADADRSIKNPSRVMRLAGSWYTKGSEPTQGKIISASGQRYSFSQLRELIPTPDAAPPEIHRPPAQKPQPLPTSDSIPLIKLLSVEHRQLIDSGVSQGSRNSTAHQIALDALGAESWARANGVNLEGSAWDLVQTFTSRCAPALSDREVQQLFDSAQRSNPSPCLSEDKLWNCVAAHQKPSPRATVTHISSVKKASKEDPNLLPLKQQLEALLEKDLDPAARRAALLDLASLRGRTLREVESLLESIESTREQQEDLLETAERFNQLVALEAKRLDLHKVLPSNLADPMLATAAAMPTTPAALITSFLPAAASRIGTAARVVVKASAGYTQPCIIRSAIVANTGDRKTPTQKAVLDPLYKLENQAYEEWQRKMDKYQAEMDDYKGEGPKPQKPAPRDRYIINDITLEAKIRVHSENPRGLLDYTDELSGRFARMNKYRAGNGDDLQLDLSEFNGGAISKDRTRESIFLPRSAISSTGSIQWETLQTLREKLGLDDSAGIWARWLFCVTPMPAPYLNLTGQDADRDTGLGKILEAVYARLGQLPQVDYLLSTEAKARFEKWQHKLVDKLQTETIPALKAAYPKLESYAVRLALLLHILWAVAANEKPSPSISEETMVRALCLVNFYMGQLRLVVSHSGGDQQTRLEGSLLKVKALLDRKGAITARDIKTSIWSLRQTHTDEIRSLMGALEKMGAGHLEGTGRKAVLRKNVDAVDELLMPHQQDQSQSQSRIQRFVDDVEATPCVSGEDPKGDRRSSSHETPDRGCGGARTQTASTPSTIASPEPETQIGQRLERKDRPSTIHQQNLNSINNWLPAVGEQVRYIPGKAPYTVWEGLELQVVKVVDPDKGIVAVRGREWIVSQQASPAILQPA